jgi:hypothetical protein
VFLLGTYVTFLHLVDRSVSAIQLNVLLLPNAVCKSMDVFRIFFVFILCCFVVSLCLLMLLLCSRADLVIGS